ncbi:sigma-70 family RNA polymerase sigma factor [Antrihabitans stalactiti]|uniref:Sigma-70 family RNA polymerase sigma factor n=1 Tax=Antrihabitans stalactiti TaxID=2584121 RepID=A0A848KDW4_9NOCA|nr:sigma-70 family RNA polymerase sigma factor [Antrihabitans stalactiti]NMN96489.1 sigma-70 family RNA polymerase sigma factor [Antrihabitans stalactiti]
MSVQEMTAEAGHPTVEDVWRRFGAELRSFVHRRINDPYRADDIVSEVLIKIHENVGSLDDRERLAGWVFRIARNAVTDEYRRVARAREQLDAAPGDMRDDVEASWDSSDEVMTELAGCLRPLLEGLTPTYRRALELTDLDGNAQAEAARLEGISVSGMKSRVQRGRQQLVDVLRRCCALTLDSRGMPMEYTRPDSCGCSGSSAHPA